MHYEDGEPIQLEQRIVNAAITPDFIKQNFSLITPVSYLLSKSAPSRVEQDIQATSASRHVSRLLNMEFGDPVLMIKRVTWRHEEITTRAFFYHPGHAYQLGSGTMDARQPITGG